MRAKTRLTSFGIGAVILAAETFIVAPAHADVVISSAQTQNVSCSGGVCAPTATDAVLNVGDLETYLASGNIEITTTGSGVEANNIDVKAPLSWSTANTLALQAYDSVAIAQHVSVKGQGGLSIVTNNGGSGGTLSTGPKGRISFANLSSALTINGAAYTLVNSVKSLASAIANNSSGDYALADNYDASQDGTYSNSPVTTRLAGIVEGLGNTISNINIDMPKPAQFDVGGLFFAVNSGAGVENLSLANLKLSMKPYERGVSQNVGGLAELNEGFLSNDHVSGKIAVDAKNSGGDSLVGGLAAYTDGTVSNSSAAVKIEGTDIAPGGLVSDNLLGRVTASYATGSVTNKLGGGGFAAVNDDGAISNSYATGSVKRAVDREAEIGGFLAGDSASSSASTSYSLGDLSHDAGLVGGFVGAYFGGAYSDCYWDTTTSGTGEGTGEGNVPGITGLTTKQLKSGLPPGFDPTIWAEDKRINHGFPYLISNPPPEK